MSATHSVDRRDVIDANGVVAQVVCTTGTETDEPSVAEGIDLPCVTSVIATVRGETGVTLTQGWLRAWVKNPYLGGWDRAPQFDVAVVGDMTVFLATPKWGQFVMLPDGLNGACTITLIGILPKGIVG